MKTLYGHAYQLTSGEWKFGGTLATNPGDTENLQYDGKGNFISKEEAEVAMKDFCKANGIELILRS